MEINQAAEILSDYLNTHKPIKQEYSAEQIADLMNRQIDMRLQAFGSDDEPSVQPEQLRADLELMRSNLSDIQGILDDVETKLLKVGLEIDDVNENLTNSFRKLEQYRDAVREDIEKAESFLDVNQTREVAGAYDQAEREEEQEKHEQIMDAARTEDNERMISISVYKDSTGLYTEEEIQDDNLVDLYFPESIVADYVGSNEGWTHDDLLEHKLRLLFLPNYTADDTVGLVDFAKERGFEVSKQLPAEYILRQLDSSDMSLTDYVTENYSAAVSVMEHGGSLYDLDSMIAMKEALGRDITYDEFSKVNGTDIFDDMGLYNITKNEVPLVEAILSDKVHTIEEARIWEEERAENNMDGIEKAKAVISEYLREEFGNTPELDDLTSIGLAYTTIDNPELLKSAGVTNFDREFEIQVDANLRDREINTYIDGDELSTIKFDSMDEMVEYMESNLDFGSLTSLSDHDWQVLADRVIDQEAAQALDEHEAEFGADGRRAFPRLNETKEETLAIKIDRFMSLSMPEYDAAIDREKNIKTLTEFLEYGHYDEVKRLFNDVIRHSNAETPELEEMALKLSAQVNDLEAERTRSKTIPELTGTESAHNITAKQEKLTVSVSSKLVGEPFKAKDGNFYVRVKLPNENKADKSPWGSIVVKPDQVTENKVTGKTDISLNANGTVTIFKPEVVCYNQVNQPEYVNRKIKISTADLKKRFTRTEPKNIKNLITKNTKRKNEINQQKQQKDKQINTPVKKNSIGRD